MGTNPFLPSTSGLQPNAGVNGAPGAITAVSSTTQTISSGLLSFQVPNQAAWAPGMIVSVVDAANSANYMWGTVSSYSGTTLVIDVLGTAGSGTYSSWLINISGVGGGATGATGPQGPAGANGTSPGIAAPSCQGLTITNNGTTPNTKINIAALWANVVSGGFNVAGPITGITIDLTTGTSSAAANGMDGEARGTNAWIYLYLISNGTQISGLASLQPPSVGPTLPASGGWQPYAAYVGAMRVDGSGNLLRTAQNKNRTRYVVTGSTNTASLPAMGNGTAGSTSVPTWVSIAVANFVPVTASNIHLIANGDVGGTAVAVIVAPNNAYGTAGSTNPPPIAVAAAAGTTYGINELQLESSSIYWASGGTDGYLFCAGWDDYAACV